MENKNRVQETIDQLKRFIEEEHFLAGTKLPIEKQLAEKFLVGRSTLREAVKILQYANVLEVRQGSGTYVKQESLSIGWQKELLEARETVESAAGKLACLYRTEEELLSLNQALFKRNRLLEQGHFSEYIEADLAFHLLLVQCSHHSIYIRWYQELIPSLRTWLSSQVIDSKNYLDNTKSHQEMFQGIINRNETEVVQAILENSRRMASSEKYKNQ